MRLVRRTGEWLARVQRTFRGVPPGVRRAAAMVVDALIVLESFAIALLFRFAGDVPSQWLVTFVPFALVGAVVFVALLHESGVYRSILRYTGIYQGVRVASATLVATGILMIISFGVGELLALVEEGATRPMPFGVILIGSVLAFVQLAAVRLYPRVFYELSLREVVDRRTRAAIVGTGEAAVSLAGHIWRTPGMNAQVVGFVADSPEEVGRQIEGVTVLGMPEDLEDLITDHGIDQVIVARPQASREEMDGIWHASRRAKAEVKVMPDLGEFLAQGTLKLRELQIEDLLGREPVDIDLDALSGYVNGKRVMVTGAAGSIGSELSRQISRLGPAKLVLLDRDESGLYYLNGDLRREEFYDAETVVGDVTNQERIGFLFERYRPHLVFHAAAYKHVPMMELQATECITNNVSGTLNVARAAGAYGAGKFVNVSTDKAVNPANVMGATKRLAETVVRQTAAEYPETVYASVRFGNVLGSRGSVVPTFKQQIEAGGPVTVTHPEMIRYFMTIPEAVSLILQAGAMAEDYATYVLEMGRPIRITELANKMIEMMGAPDVRIKFVGLRPGEKLEEELFGEGERSMATDHPMVFKLLVEEASSLPPSLPDLVEDLIHFARAQEPEKSLKLLRSAVPNYAEADLPERLPEGEFRQPKGR